MPNVKCKSCGHTTKPGLVNADGLCPVCAGEQEPEAEPETEGDG